MPPSTRSRLPIIPSAALGIVGVFAVMLASPTAEAQLLTPQTGTFSGTVPCLASITIGPNMVSTCSSLGAYSATGDTGTGFAGVPNNTPATYNGSSGLAIDPTQSSESQTLTAINAYFSVPGVGITFGGGLAGLESTNVSLVGHAPVVNNAIQLPGNFSGSGTLTNAGASGSALAFFNDVNSLTGGSDQISFSGTVNNTPTPGLFSFSLSFLPIVTAASVTTTTGPSTAALLGGAGVPGGVTVTLGNPASTGTLSATYANLNAAQVMGLLTPAAAATLGNLNVGVAFTTTGQAQGWNVSYTGSPGTQITLTFTYNPALFGANFNASQLEVGHVLADGSVVVLTPTSIDPVADTITVQTTGFSNYLLLAPVPEPGTGLLVMAGVLGLAVRRRRPRAASRGECTSV